MIASRGQTLGKKAMGVKVIDYADGDLPSMTMSFKRWIFYGVTSAVGNLFGQEQPGIFIAAAFGLIAFLVLASPLFDGQRRGWHDKLAKTVVIRTKVRVTRDMDLDHPRAIELDNGYSVMRAGLVRRLWARIIDLFIVLVVSISLLIGVAQITPDKWLPAYIFWDYDPSTGTYFLPEYDQITREYNYYEYDEGSDTYLFYEYDPNDRRYYYYPYSPPWEEVALLLPFVVFFLAGLIYHLPLIGLRGRTLGKAWLGVAVARFSNGKPPGWGKAFVRHFIYDISLILVIPWVLMNSSPLFHSQRRGWHDLASETILIDKEFLRPKSYQEIPATPNSSEYPSLF